MKHAARFVLVFLICAPAYAQSELVGKYSGQFMGLANIGRGERQYFLVVEINAADSGKLKGSLTNSRDSYCGMATYEAQGTYEGNNVKVVQTATKGRGCEPLKFEGIVDGNKMVGKVLFNGELRDLTLSK